MSLKSPFLSNELFVEAESFAPNYSLSTLESPFLADFAADFSSPASSEEEEFPPEDTLEFRESIDEEADEQWIDVEYDSSSAGISDTPDSLLAVPAFAGDKRALIGTPLTPVQSKAAVKWNSKNHPGKSGVDPHSIRAALQSYVDFSAVSGAIANYNSQNPTAPINLGTGPIDAVFVEALHQFQINCYKDSKQHDGLAGPSVLDSLGFWPRKGLRSSAQTNEWARKQVQARATSIDTAITGMPPDLARDLSAKNWWSSFVNPSFLGQTFTRPIHVYFARKLRKAELWLLSQPRFARKTPVELADLLDINEKHAGGRKSAGSKSSHTLGLAIDIKYLGNPHVGDYRDKPIGAERFSEVMKRAATKISGITWAEKKFPEYLHTLGNDASKNTGQIYDELSQRDQDLRRYLALPEASDDLAALTQGVFKGSQVRDPRNGFLNLDKDLVIALRDHACLVWGAVDFGSGANGDIMHFDCRLDDIGRAVYCRTGATFNDKHPCWLRAEQPCPPPPSRSRTAPARAAEVLYSECEDEYEYEAEDADYLPDYEDDSPIDELEAAEESDLEELEDQVTQQPKVLDIGLMLDDLRTPIGEEQIIGLDGGANLNIQLSVSDTDAAGRTHVNVELLIRTPGKPRAKIVTRTLKVPKKGLDPNDPSKVFYELSIPTAELVKILSPLDKVKEIATVRRIGGTSDRKLIRALGSGWQLRGQAEQADKCGTSSGSFADERPDAFKLMQAGGVAILEISDPSKTKSIKRFIRNPADIFYYTGHGLGVGFSRRTSAATPLNCLAIEDHVTAGGYCCWVKPSDIIPVWKSPMDLDVFIIAGCSVLAVDASSGSVSGDGLEWAKLTQAGGGPLIALLGYGDWDNNEDGGQGPMGATAPYDKSGGDEIATEMGKWIKSNPLKGIIRKWLTLNMSHQNPFAVGFDGDGFCWRTRRKSTSGWKVEARLITKDRIRYVIEKLKVI